MRLKGLLSLAVLVALATAVAGCGASAGTGATAARSKGTVTVGSKIDTEGGVLGQMVVAALKADGFTVVDRTKTGTTDVVRKALTSGEIDLYPEYTGTALTQFFPGSTVATGVSTDARACFETVKKLDAARNGIDWLQAAPADNTWAIAIPRKLSRSADIKTLADWAAYIKKGGPVKLVASQEFVDRAADGLPAVERAYGFKLSASQLVVLSGGDTAQTEAAAAQGTSGANAAMAYGTDGNLAALDLVVLQDPKGTWPVYQPAPTVRAEVLKRYPRIATVLGPVFKSLTLERLQELNGKVAVDGEDPAAVATAYLKSNNFIK